MMPKLEKAFIDTEERMKPCRILGYLPTIIDCGKCLKPYVTISGLKKDGTVLTDKDLMKELATHGWYFSLVFGYICPDCVNEMIKEVENIKSPMGFDL